MTRRRLRTVAVAVAVVIGACGADDPVVDRAIDPVVDPTVASSASTTAAPPATTTEPGVEIAIRVDVRVDDVAESDFAATVQATLTDPRGWGQAGFRFTFRDDAPYTMLLAEADEVDATCLPYDTGGRFSCQIGPTVALNADRWRTATESWPASLTEYRQMLVNHEVGHLLGRHHARPNCPAAGALAPVMAQQSSTLGDCAPNPWPLPWEIACVAVDPEPLAPPYEPAARAECGVDGVLDP